MYFNPQLTGDYTSVYVTGLAREWRSSTNGTRLSLGFNPMMSVPTSSGQSKHVVSVNAGNRFI